MRSDTLPTVVKSPSTNLTLFENANIDLTEGFAPSFYTEAKESERNLATTSGQTPNEEKPIEKGEAPGKLYQKLMEESTTRFPLGVCSGEIKISDTAREMVAYIFASMIDSSLWIFETKLRGLRHGMAFSNGSPLSELWIDMSPWLICILMTCNIWLKDECGR
ncbi:hypothetical protein HOLleu_45033 [Holothuria leucospilota]|uniref:Uncharacterized protein n=1 Tax=Holothuria leucospilota TaxID=206669 RepID=A0A9Q1B956_HOLLE|nr:hypothetical protein HOLleu_45033 [Holothuria leucospilota]